MLQEFELDYNRLFLNLDADAASAQFVGARVKLKCAKAVHHEDLLVVEVLSLGSREV
jgi:hypothetical protein